MQQTGSGKKVSLISPWQRILAGLLALVVAVVVCVLGMVLVIEKSSSVAIKTRFVKAMIEDEDTRFAAHLFLTADQLEEMLGTRTTQLYFLDEPAYFNLSGFKKLIAFFWNNSGFAKEEE